MTEQTHSPAQFVRQALLFEMALGLAAVVFGLWMDRPPWRRFDWTLAAGAWGIATALPMLLLLLSLRLIHRGPIGRLNRLVDSMVVPLFVGCTVGDLALIAIVAGLGEEMLFRGAIQPVLGNWLGPVTGLVCASLVFGLAHAITPTYAVLTALIGGYLGWLYLQSDNLLIPATAHALYDFVAIVYLQRSNIKPEVEQR
jgi:membrane protease YdiL (CAAX protease family)